MDSDELDVVLAAASMLLSSTNALLDIINKTQKKKKRRWWVNSLNISRSRYSGSNLLEDLRREPSGKFSNFCRMSATDFEYLINKIGPEICKMDTNMRKCIPVQERLAVTLRFLATGDSYQSLAFLFKFSAQLISTIIPEVCQAIINALQEFIKLPKHRGEWEEIATEFENIWNFPHCIGALDGKHILIQAPYNSGSQFYNYKNTFSIVLMALADAHYCFSYADIGCQGRISDGGVFRNTNLYQKMEQNEIDFPQNQPLQGRKLSVPYVFVGDDAFPLSERILKPYPGCHPKGSMRRVFNYRLSRARRIVENTFGIMVAVFRVFRSPMLLQPDKVTKVVMTCVLLHNFLRKSESSANLYTPVDTFDREVNGILIEGSWRREVGNNSAVKPLVKIGRKATVEAQTIRNEFAEYFSTTGQLSWQNVYA